MAERKAVNKYYPPDWTPQQGSINKYVGQHPLRERARKLSQGILVIRFEMPYNIWCGGCNSHIGMGVRYNAEKKKVGNYYTTPIYRFRMKCHLCDNYFEIDTDPKNCDYVIVSGARRKEERWEPSATENVQAADKEESKKLAEDAMYKLEHGVQDKSKSKAVAPVLEQLKDLQSVWKDDYLANQLLRKKFREEKKELKAVEATDDALKQRGALDLPLLPEMAEDIDHARRMRYHGEGYEEHKKKRRFEITNKPLFKSTQVGLRSQDNKLKHSLLEKRQKMQIYKRSSSFSKADNDLSKYGVLARHKKKYDPDSDILTSSISDLDHTLSNQQFSSIDAEESPLGETKRDSECEPQNGLTASSLDGSCNVNNSYVHCDKSGYEASSISRDGSCHARDISKDAEQSAEHGGGACSGGLSVSHKSGPSVDVIPSEYSVTNVRNKSESSLCSNSYSLVSCEYDDSSDTSV